MFESFLEKSQKNGPLAEKNDRKSKRTRQKKKTGDRKGESDDSPEIPDRRKTSDIPSLPLGSGGRGYLCIHQHHWEQRHRFNAPLISLKLGVMWQIQPRQESTHYMTEFESQWQLASFLSSAFATLWKFSVCVCKLVDVCVYAYMCVHVHVYKLQWICV